jgi:hypothetical protein
MKITLRGSWDARKKVFDNFTLMSRFSIGKPLTKEMPSGVFAVVV